MKVFPGIFLEPGVRGVYQGKQFEVILIPETGTLHCGEPLLNDCRNKCFVLMDGSETEELFCFPLLMDEAFMRETFPDYFLQKT